MSKIRNTSKKNKQVSSNEKIPNYDDYPIIFSLERIPSSEFCFSTLCDECKKQFAESVFKRKLETWKDLKIYGRHGLGFENIPKNQIPNKLSNILTDDMNHVLSFRYSGKKVMIGYRIKNIFYVLGFDPTFKIYKHG